MRVAGGPRGLARPTVPAMDDRTLVAAMVDGDPRGLDGAYRRYADRLYTYCRGLLGDPHAAADAVHDTFMIASGKAGELRDPDRLQAWLYTVARRECLRIQRAGRRKAPLTTEVDPEADLTDPGRDVHARQLQDIVRAAMVGLSPADREVIELALRYDVTGPALGQVLGVSANHAHARLSRARSALQRALGAVLVTRAPAPRCPELEEVLVGWDGALTPLLRKRVSRHIEQCGRCAGIQAAMLNPAELLPALAALPLLAAPATIWARVAAQPRLSTSETSRARIGRRVGAIAAVAVIAIGIGTGVVLGRLDRPDQPVAAASAAPTQTAAAAPGAGEPSLRAPDATPTDPTPAGQPLVLAFAVVATATADCLTGTRYAIDVKATTTKPVIKALLYWRTSTTRRVAMDRPTAVTAKGTTLPILAATATWWVEVTTSDGQTATTPHRTIANPC